MARTLFGLGARGDIIVEIQRALLAVGHDPKGTDGFYGKDTKAAIQSFQQARKLDATGSIDEPSWQALLQEPIPDTARRSLALTSTLEGHGYSLALGNWDGAWLTWGIVGFTMKFGKVQKILLSVNASTPQLISNTFGERAAELIRIMNDSDDVQKSWADSVTLGYRLAEPWNTGFARLGLFPEVQKVQRQLAREDYFLPAIQTAQRLGLQSELGMALCFDIHVQNGGIKQDAGDLI